MLPAPYFTQKCIVQIDGSWYGARIVYSQTIGGKEHPILYICKEFSEQNYSTIERELSAAVNYFKKFNYYLDLQKFYLQTDHNQLVYLKKRLGRNSHLTRWYLFFKQLNFEVTYKVGKLHENADGLSRKI